MTDDELIEWLHDFANNTTSQPSVEMLLAAADRIAQLIGGADEPGGSDLLAIYGKPLTTVNTDGLRAVWRAGRLSATPHEEGNE